MEDLVSAKNSYSCPISNGSAVKASYWNKVRKKKMIRQVAPPLQ